MAVATAAILGSLAAGAASAGVGAIANKALGNKATPTVNASTYALPQIEGYTNQQGIPEVPVPTYNGAPVLPYNIPTMPKPVLAPPTQGETGQGQALSNSKAALLSMIEPTSPVLQDLTNAEAQLGRIDFLKGLKSVMTANRRSQSQGRGGLFDNERQDETLSHLLQTNAQETEAGARTRAMDRLRTFSTDNQNLAGQYGNYANTERLRRNDFIGQLGNYINQLRTDTATRNSQVRQDIGTNVGQRRENVSNFLNQLNKSGPAISEANSVAKGQNAQLLTATAQPFVNALSGAFSGGSTNYGSNPWLNPDTGKMMY